MKTITKYWFLEGFNFFKKLGMLNMMKLCEILVMDNIEKGNPIDFADSKIISSSLISINENKK